MIKNKKQLKISKKRLREFESAVEKIKNDDMPKQDLRIKMQMDALDSDIKVLRKEIREFDELQSGKIKVITARTFHELPEIFIKARIARSMTQKALAESLGMKEQQIQRYENNNYASVSFSIIEKIVDALGITIEEKAHLR